MSQKELNDSFKLSPSLAAFSEQAQAVLKATVTYLHESQLAQTKVLHLEKCEQIPDILGWNKFLQKGGADFEALVRGILDYSNRLHHPGYMGHQVATPLLSSCLGDLVHGATNNAMAIYEMGPSATAAERFLIQWMLSKVKWPQGDGIFTHGGSMANLSCLLAARAATFPDAWKNGVTKAAIRAAVLASESSHYSVRRACAIMGLGEDSVITIPVDSVHRMQTEMLQWGLEQALASGRQVFAVVGNACVTASGVYDNLDEIADFCQSHGLWFHVDGAHGASALLSPKFSHYLKGLERADSLVWDTHKMLATSTLCGAALFKKSSTLAKTFSQQANYLFTESAEIQGPDLSTVTLECTKAALGFKLLFNLAAVGEEGLCNHIEGLYQKARDFYEIICATEHFETLCEPEANILCFRYLNAGEDQDSLRNQLISEGDFYITRATVNKKNWLRLALMNPATEPLHLKALLQRITEL